jgi:hypothetical protein
MNLLNTVHLGVLVATLGMAVVSARVLMLSISEGDTASAWIYAALFVVTSFMAVWSFWRLI